MLFQDLGILGIFRKFKVEPDFAEEKVKGSMS